MSRSIFLSSDSLSLTSYLCSLQSTPSFDSRPGSVASYSSSDRGPNLVVEQLRRQVLELTHANQILKAEMSMLKYFAVFKTNCNLPR